MSVPGGPFESLRALLEICARRHLPLRRGMQISTGAVTGVHIIAPGQSTLIEMAGLPAIACYAERAIAPPVLSNLT
jgi:2-keto-4-pentenoate hydratase